MRPILLSLAVAVTGAGLASAVEMPVFTWSSSGGAFSDGSNWSGGIAPPTDGSARVVMPGDWGWTYFKSGDVGIAQIQLGTSGNYYSNGSFSSESGTTLHLLNGITAASSYAYATFGGGITIDLLQNQTWQVSGSYNIYGSITGASQLTVDGSSSYYYWNSIYLGGNNSYSGGTVANATRLYLGTNTALGTGAVSLINAGLIHSGPLSVANAFTLTGDITVENYSSSAENTLSLNGAVALNGNVSLSNQSAAALYLNGGVAETSANSKLTISNGFVVLTGASTYTGGTQVGAPPYGQAGLVFRTAAAIPTTNLISATEYSYVGASFSKELQSTLLARLDPTGFLGTLGFDTAPEDAETGPTVFSENLDLTALPTAFRGLGSSTQAKITGSLNFGDNNLRFGGGGGQLTVSSDLVSPTHGLVVTSPYNQALTLILEGSNAFSQASIDTSVVRFSGPKSLPAEATIMLNNGYASATPSTGLSVSEFVGRITQSYGNSVVGFDAEDGGTRVIGDVDLSLIATNDGYVYLGTATRLKVTGEISTGTNSFAAINDGYLEIASALGLEHGSITIGLYTPFNNRAGTVALTADNTYAGGTGLQSGRLAFDRSSVLDGSLLYGPLGTGTLTVGGSRWVPDATKPTLVPLADELTLHNAIALDENLTVGDGSTFSVTLAGTISGPGSVTFANSGSLHLSGDNTFYGGLSNNTIGTLVFDSDTAAGFGALSLGEGSAVFTTSNPTVHGLAAWSYNSSIQLAANTTLNLDLRREVGEGIGEATDYFYGSIHGDNASLHLKAGTLYLYNSNTYSGSTIIGSTANSGDELKVTTPTSVNPLQQSVANATLVAGNDGALGTGEVHIDDGGTLIANATISNQIYVNQGGTLGGSGTVSSPEGILIGSGARLSPGQSPGTLSFDTTLTFAGGGQLLIEIADATGTPGSGWDSVAVINDHALLITALAATPFEITVASLQPGGYSGAASHFDANQAYTWTILTAGSIDGFSASAFTVNASSFLAANGASGSFTLSQSDNSLLLTFAPVPEPSTYLLMAAGLGVVAIIVRRRRS